MIEKLNTLPADVMDCRGGTFDGHNGSARVVMLVSLTALIMALIGGWWGLVMVPKSKAEAARQSHQQIESLVTSRSFLSSPGSKLACDALGGTWRLGQNTRSTVTVEATNPTRNTPRIVSKTQQIITPDYCSMPASDAGKACMSSAECESFCVGRMVLGEQFSAQCYPYRNTNPNGFGSVIVVEKGRPFFRLSVKSETRATSDTYEIVGAKIEVQAIDGSKLKVGDKVRATQELRDKPWFPTFGMIPGT